MMKSKFTIVGGGIAGLTTAIALHNIGIEAVIFEAAPEFKEVGAGIALSVNAMKGYAALGLEDEIRVHGRQLDAFTIYDERGRRLNQTYKKSEIKPEGPGNFMIHRADLQSFLVSKVNPTTVKFNKRMIDIEQVNNSIAIKFSDGSVHETEYLIVADGIHSVVREKLVPDSKPRFAGQTCWRCVIRNPGINLQESFETWGRAGRFGIGPLLHDKIYWYASLNAKQDDPVFKHYGIHDLQKVFNNFHSPIPAVLAASTDADLIWGDLFDIKPISKFAFDRVVLIGDAAHATTPNLGQGGAMAVEDAVILANELKKQPNASLAFANFEKRRLPRTRKIVNDSWRVGKIAQVENRLMVSARNFIMRHLPASENERQLRFLFDVEF